MPHHLSIDLETFPVNLLRKREAGNISKALILKSCCLPILLTVLLYRLLIWRVGKNFLTG